MALTFPHHQERHFVQRLGWLRAAVLGANDGIISIVSLLVGMAASGVSREVLLVSCMAAWIAGAVSMAAGEYVSVRSQSDIEQADRAMEAHELAHNPQMELQELTEIYIQRGLDQHLARQVAEQLTAHDALGAHIRDEIGITEQTAAQPLLAAFSSALAFSGGGLLAWIAVYVLPQQHLSLNLAIVGIISLMALGALSGYLSGLSMFRAALRISIWGAASMLMTTWIGSLFHVQV